MTVNSIYTFSDERISGFSLISVLRTGTPGKLADWPKIDEIALKVDGNEK